MKTIQRVIFTWAIVAVTTIITMPSAHAQDQAAVVIVAAGEVFALDQQQKKRSLQRRSKVFVGDTLVTGPEGRAQVRFIDGAVVSLRPETELNIQKYRYGKSKADEGSLMTLIKGGFRTITGAIGKENYKLITNLATIGIRGTHYEAVIENNQLFVALWDGGVTVSNNAGQIDLGLGANYNFGMVQSGNIEPQGQIDPPAAIINDTQPQFLPDLSASTPTGGQAVADASWGVDTDKLQDEAVTDTASTTGITMPTTGTAVYANVASISGTGSTSAINNFAYSATVDFAAATISGSMSFVTHSGSNSWAIDFSGNPANGTGVNGTGFSMNVDNTSMVNGFDPVSGTISGNFTGDNATSMEGQFVVVNDNDTSVTAEGSYTATQ